MMSWDAFLAYSMYYLCLPSGISHEYPLGRYQWATSVYWPSTTKGNNVMSKLTSKFTSKKEFTRALNGLCKRAANLTVLVQELCEYAILYATPQPVGNGNLTPLRDLIVRTAGIGSIRGKAIQNYCFAHIENITWKTDKNGDKTIAKKDKDLPIRVSDLSVDDSGSVILWCDFQKEAGAVSPYSVMSDESINKRMDKVSDRVDATDKVEAIESQILFLQAQMDVMVARLESLQAAAEIAALESVVEGDTSDTPTVTGESEVVEGESEAVAA